MFLKNASGQMFCARAVETSFLLCMIPPQLHYFAIVCKVHCKYSKSLRETAPIGIFLPIVRCTTTSILSVESGMTEVLGNVRSDLCLQHNQAFLDLVARPEGPLNPGCRAQRVDCPLFFSRGILADVDRFCVLLPQAINRNPCN